MFGTKSTMSGLLYVLCGRMRFGYQVVELHIGLGNGMFWRMWHCVKGYDRDLECVESLPIMVCIGLWMFETICLTRSCEQTPQEETYVTVLCVVGISPAQSDQ